MHTPHNRTAATPTHLHIPRLLVGRERLTRKLEMIFSHVSRGPGEIILVPGHSGVGKTSLEEWLKTPVHAKNGLFIQSKFDQYLRVGVTRPALMWCNRGD